MIKQLQLLASLILVISLILSLLYAVFSILVVGTIIALLVFTIYKFNVTEHKL